MDIQSENEIIGLIQNKNYLEILNCFKQKLNEIEKKVLAIDFEKRTVVVWGAGNTSEMQASVFDEERMNVKYFADNDINKQKKLFCGKKVLSCEEVRKLENPIVLISCGTIEGIIYIREQLNKYNIESMTIEEYMYGTYKKSVVEAIELLNDEESKIVYCSLLLGKILEINIQSLVCVDNQYFALDQINVFNTDEVFVDVGAYTGDTIAQYIEKSRGCFKKIYAFEPAEYNKAELEKTIDNLQENWKFDHSKIEIIQAGLGDKNTFMCTSSDCGVGVRLQSTLETVNSIQVYRLDDYLTNKKITFLKADIEGFEMKLLKGAKRVIKEYKPRLAISIYHKVSDYYELIIYLKSLVSSYHFAIRHHTEMNDETVLYVW